MTTSRAKTTFRTIPITRIIEQLNGPSRRVAVYNFGNIEKFEREDQAGQVYFWARGIRQTNN